MRQGIIAGLSVAFVAIVLIVSLIIVQTRTPANRFEACLTGGVAGGDVGGPFSLIDQSGMRVTDRDVITEPSLVYFGYTFCPDVCPFDVARNALAVDILAEQGQSVTPVFVTVDPARDTVEYLADFAANHHPKMIALTGTKEEIAMAARAYRAFYSRGDGDDEYYLMNHSTLTYLMLPDHGFVQFFRNDLPAEDLAEQVACFVAAA